MRQWRNILCFLLIYLSLSAPSPFCPFRLWPLLPRAFWWVPPLPSASAPWFLFCHLLASGWRSQLQESGRQRAMSRCSEDFSIHEFHSLSDFIPILNKSVISSELVSLDLTFLCWELADVHCFVEDFDSQSQGRGQSHLSFFVVLLQHRNSSLKPR